MTLVVVIEGVVIVLLLILMSGLLKSHADILRQLDRISRSAVIEPDSRPRSSGLGQAPSMEIVGIEPTGSAARVSLRKKEGATLVAFLSTGCASCRVFWSDLGKRELMPTASTRALIITQGPDRESPSKVASLAPADVRVVMSDDAWDAFRVPLTPYFMMVNGVGQVMGEGSASNLDHLADLFAQAAGDSAPLRMSTNDRAARVDQSLTESGVDPGDPSLYQDPLGP